MIEGDPEKSWSGIETERELNKRRLGWRLAWWGSTEKEGSYLVGLRGRHQYPDQRYNQTRAPSVVSTAIGTEREKDQMARSSA